MTIVEWVKALDDFSHDEQVTALSLIAPRVLHDAVVIPLDVAHCLSEMDTFSYNATMSMIPPAKRGRKQERRITADIAVAADLRAAGLPWKEVARLMARRPGAKRTWQSYKRMVAAFHKSGRLDILKIPKKKAAPQTAAA